MLQGHCKGLPRLWQSVSAEVAVLASQSSSWQNTCSLLPCAQGFKSRGYASGANVQDSDSQMKEYPELRALLNKGNSVQSGSGSRQQTSGELPIGGGIMPELPKVETPTSRLLGRKGHEQLTQLRDTVKPGEIGTAISKAIQELQGKGPQVGFSARFGAAGDLGELMERWEELLKQNDVNSVEQQMEARPRDVQRIAAVISEAEEKARQAEEKATRRQREDAIKAAFAASRVKDVDELGRAYGTGKRKTSIARVWIKEPPKERAGLGRIMVNGRRFFDYFGPILTREEVLKPLEVTETIGMFDLRVNVIGGGFSGQAQAIRHGLSKALQNWNPEHRPALKAAGFLTRDRRIVERKKPGRAKARKAFQWVKR